ncbi:MULTISPECIES: gamma-glutamyl-gamma-aminobutyrate hydrolase family protein [Thiorhodovibrio]|uniref:gamma-glutamyl-gamma-aminobutyrate hydrolase family protein n=1 Tax=Thiorhodovibrio TaxID=61593 RepID=UPI001913686F|nr:MULTISPECIES: type 1 glutamine amidotransferase [Thiorhodovibrio]MBK5971093.1 peptidase C26 [Thiorhodovibrio winogradskyi]WPL10539.1 Putative glutamine amidotransferasec [Thiorhodovibrio litoralis]
MANADIRPLIGITGPRHGALMPRGLVALGVWIAGGQPRQLYPGIAEDAIDSLAGLVVTGGHDVDPVLYAAAPEVTPKIDTERDRFESAAIDRMLARQRPLLGICRGAQLLNVRRGGSLFQELRSRRKQTSNRWTIFPLKTLLIEANTALHDRFGCGRCCINSLHNQGIDRLGGNLRIAGRDLDGIVQAVEDPDADYVVGVQWHPEFLLYLSRQRRLFRDLITAACAPL